jgi:histidinol-phosphate aminotransferase
MGRPLVREDLSVLEGYHSPQLEVEVRLNTNEAPEPPPDAFRRAVSDAVTVVAWNRYPDRSATELRRAIGRLHHHSLDEVFCANGSNEVLQTLLLAFAGPGRTVLTFEPTYAMHGHIARVVGSVTVAGGRRDDFGLDEDQVERLITTHRPEVTFLCSPNNPTGTVETAATVTRVLDLVEAVDGLLVVDEAYGQFAPWSAIELLGPDRSLVVTRTFSKTWAMAGARLGYLLGPAWLVAELDRVVLPYHLDVVKQQAGLVALRFVEEMERRVTGIVEERDRVQAALSDLGVTMWPSGANFVLFRPPAPAAAATGPSIGRRVWEALVERSVLIRDTSSWDRLDGCLRVTIGARRENDRFLAALAEILAPVTSGRVGPEPNEEAR